MLLALCGKLAIMNSKRLNGKVAIITGAAQGQGKATALRFAQEGARVTCFDIQPLDKIRETVDEIKKFGSDGIAVCGDVSKASDIDTCISSTVENIALHRSIRQPKPDLGLTEIRPARVY